MSLLASLYDHFLQHSLPHLGAAGLLIVGMLALSRKALGNTMREASTRQQSISKGPAREPGVWVPMDFQAPEPAPYPNWDIHKTKPLPYRPFKHGPKYHITMGIRKMDFDEWIELDNQFLEFHAIKSTRIASRGSRCCVTNPVAYAAALELLEHLASYLPSRYPTLYRRTPAGGLGNLVTGESFDVLARPLAEDAMQMAARMVQDDLAIMVEGSDGQYYLQAGSILLPGSWRLQDKLGMPLDEVHTSGDVPGYAEKLAKGMNRFFSRIQPAGPVVRNNYIMQEDDCLPWSHSMGPEDKDQTTDVCNAGDNNKKQKDISDFHFRSERQTLRRLPRSGGVVFTIRTYFVPLVQLASEPYVPGRLASAIRSWGKDVARYKGRERWQDLVLAYLDEQHRRQVEEDGLDLSAEDLDCYPY